jgi:hypothetical protein
LQGVFLFNHGRCGTTLSFRNDAFASVSLMPTLRDSCAVTGHAKDYCLALRDNQPCPPSCVCEDIARISHVILGWPKERIV